MANSLRTDLAALVGPAALTGATLVALHHRFWGDGHRGPFWKAMGRLGTYTLGVATLNSGFTWWAARTGYGRAAGALWLLSAVGGLTVSACWVAHSPSLALHALVAGAQDVRTRTQAMGRLIHLAAQAPDPGRWAGREVH